MPNAAGARVRERASTSWQDKPSCIFSLSHPIAHVSTSRHTLFPLSPLLALLTDCNETPPNAFPSSASIHDLPRHTRRVAPSSSPAIACQHDVLRDTPTNRNGREEDLTKERTSDTLDSALFASGAATELAMSLSQTTNDEDDTAEQRNDGNFLPVLLSLSLPYKTLNEDGRRRRRRMD